MNYSEKITVAYTAGPYGSYLLWLLWTLTTDNDIVAPFVANKGTSHKFYDQAGSDLLILNPSNLDSNINNNLDAKFIAIHPKVSAEGNIADTLDTLVNKLGKIVLVYPTTETYLLNINNFTSKVYNSFKKQFECFCSTVSHVLYI